MLGREMGRGLLLGAIDGANPLGFLASLGAAVVARVTHPNLRIGWRFVAAAWRPLLVGAGDDASRFVKALYGSLVDMPVDHLEIDRGLPFDATKFRTALERASQQATADSRHLVDHLAAFGSEMYPDENTFQDTKFRMVRRGDSAGQGLPAYALAIRKAVTMGALDRALFGAWDYLDEGFSLRWDPIEDQRYALRWRNPAQSKKGEGPGTMLGANNLALEALALFPTAMVGSVLATTGFRRQGKRAAWFTWPIWEQAVELDTVRSLLALAELQRPIPDRRQLAAMGIAEVFRSQRIAQNQYYSNFAPAVPA
ncbi:MAG: hypothetical protein QM286_04410 [Acidobacteriota bacterium]|nr:hypothetical protein [Thermoanaerobaculaceae bacterium]MDI9621808.1 hypothetical protein [Acidobacteriota bacterium]MDI9627773.1 hypothetical protein [Acidobacteriota bacterium]HPW54477.1 hypothetical protein [Thermoanaerobaculaceae bacterium]